MNRIDQLFKQRTGNILSVYFTAGFPKLEDTRRILRALQAQGADMVEIGIPFSDPLADGPVIQRSSEAALENGMTLKVLFEQLTDIRKEVTIPLVLMGYVNPIVRYGVEAFCKKAQALGIDGVIVPDLPLDLYIEEYKDIFEQHGLHNIFLITPQTPDERITKIVKHSHGFLYMVSSAATTGAKSSISSDQIGYFERIRNMQLPMPKLIGFGISNRETFERACEYSEGAIIGSAFIKALQEEGSLEENIARFVASIRG